MSLYMYMLLSCCMHVVHVPEKHTCVCATTAVVARPTTTFATPQPYRRRVAISGRAQTARRPLSHLPVPFPDGERARIARKLGGGGGALGRHARTSAGGKSCGRSNERVALNKGVRASRTPLRNAEQPSADGRRSKSAVGATRATALTYITQYPNI